MRVEELDTLLRLRPYGAVTVFYVPDAARGDLSHPLVRRGFVSRLDRDQFGDFAECHFVPHTCEYDDPTRVLPRNLFLAPVERFEIFDLLWRQELDTYRRVCSA